MQNLLVIQILDLFLNVFFFKRISFCFKKMNWCQCQSCVHFTCEKGLVHFDKVQVFYFHFDNVKMEAEIKSQLQI